MSSEVYFHHFQFCPNPRDIWFALKGLFAVLGRFFKRSWSQINRGLYCTNTCLVESKLQYLNADEMGSRRRLKVTCKVWLLYWLSPSSATPKEMIFWFFSKKELHTKRSISKTYFIPSVVKNVLKFNCLKILFLIKILILTMIKDSNQTFMTY